MGVAVNQIYYALNRVFASGLMEGSISALNYANLVMTLPLGVFVSAIVSAIYPALSTHAITGDKRSLADTMLKGLGMVSLIAIPAAVGLMVLRVPIVSLLFERGMFDHQATMATAQALLYFSVGLFPAAANMIITRAYYAVSDVRTPVVVGLISIVADLLLSIVLVGKMGHAGLALANSLAAGVNTLFLFYGLKKHIPDLKARKLLISLGKICAASILMAVITYFIASYLGQKINLEGDRGLIILVGTAISAGALSYFIAATAFKVEDIRSVQEIMIRKIRKIPRRVDN